MCSKAESSFEWVIERNTSDHKPIFIFLNKSDRLMDLLSQCYSSERACDCLKDIVNLFADRYRDIARRKKPDSLIHIYTTNATDTEDLRMVLSHVCREAVASRYQPTKRSSIPESSGLQPLLSRATEDEPELAIPIDEKVDRKSRRSF